MISIPCPACEDGTLVKRWNAKHKTAFMGCTNYPICTHTEAIPEYVKMVALGHPRLFDDDLEVPDASSS